MKKKLGLLFIVIFCSSNVFASLPYQSNLNSVIEDFDIKDALNNMTELKYSVDMITDELDGLDKEEINNDGMISDKYREVRKEVVNVIQTINSTTTDVEKILKKLTAYKKQIYIAQKDLEETRKNKEIVKENIQNFTNILYKVDKSLYSEESNQIDEIKLLLQSDNIPQTLASDFVVKSMVIKMWELMKQLAENEKKQIELIKRFNKLKINSKNQITNYNTQLEKLQQKKEYLISFMELYKNETFREKAEMKNLFDSMKDIHNAIYSMANDIENKNYNTSFDIKKALKILDNMEETEQQETHPVAWPVYPISHLYTYFWDQGFEKEYWVPQDGISIVSKQGNPVYSARHGIIYHVSNSDGIGINRVLILHNNWYLSVYQYLNKILVEPGQIVRRGELIWYSGGEPGTRGAGFLSKWPNLTFQVWKNGNPVDPFQVLDASVVRNKDILPDNYHIKYLKDKYLRPIDITELKFMTWATNLQRADQFLNLYAVWIYKELAFWEDAIKWTNIDRDVLICVSFAESTLGRHLSTANNIGNVGNNDRGDRIPFSSALAGARAIADTLNNQYLGHYHTIEQLSRYGNEDGKIYASSTINRQTNVLKCLSQIKWYYIPEDYPFRTWPNPNKISE